MIFILDKQQAIYITKTDEDGWYINSNNIKISVIIPVYNCHEYLDRCLLSVIKKTFTNLKLIIINDGSTDLTIECKISTYICTKAIKFF